MFIYNVTVKVDWSIHEAWVQWMLHEHMPEMIRTGCFTGSKLLRLLEIDEKDGPTYVHNTLPIANQIITVILKIIQPQYDKSILIHGEIVL